MRRSNVLGLGGITNTPDCSLFIHYINCMVFNNSFPDIYLPCLVQINYKDGDVVFHLAKNFQDGLDSYGGGTLVAIFKCKPKLKP
jgi:hypothetical protein